MDVIEAMSFIEENKEFLFPNDKFSENEITEALINMPEELEMSIRSISFRNPKTMQIISFFVGVLGVDRFMLGDIGKGVIKYFTFGGLGIWWIKDLINVKDRCRAYNCKKIKDVINDPALISKMQKSDFDLQKAINITKTVAPIVKDLKDGAGNVRDTFRVD